MNIQVSEKAAKWYAEEMELVKGDYVRLFVRYGGYCDLHPGFSLGITIDTPFDIGAKTTVDGIHFYVEESDLWFFDGQHLKVVLNEKKEPEYLIVN